ncbi:hypothetical protein [Streptomyces sp. NPDC055400]
MAVQPEKLDGQGVGFGIGGGGQRVLVGPDRQLVVRGALLPEDLAVRLSMPSRRFGCDRGPGAEYGGKGAAGSSDHIL